MGDSPRYPKIEDFPVTKRTPGDGSSRLADGALLPHGFVIALRKFMVSANVAVSVPKLADIYGVPTKVLDDALKGRTHGSRFALPVKKRRVFGNFGKRKRSFNGFQKRVLNLARMDFDAFQIAKSLTEGDLNPVLDAFPRCWTIRGTLKLELVERLRSRILRGKAEPQPTYRSLAERLRMWKGPTKAPR